MKKLLAIVLIVPLLAMAFGVSIALAEEPFEGEGIADHGTVMGTPVPMAESFRMIVSGDYMAAGVGMRDTNGSGTITLPADPGGATIQKAFLYWAIITSTPVAAHAQGSINGNAITGTLIGSTAHPCWWGSIYNYVADVTAHALFGANTLTGFASGGPVDLDPLLEGASLVAIYTQPGASVKTVIIQQGAVTFAAPPTETTTFSGFSAVSGSSQTTWIVADGQGNATEPHNRTWVDGNMTASSVLDGAGPGTWYWDTLTQDITTYIPAGDTAVTIGTESATNDCITWVAQVLSVPTEDMTVTKVLTSGPEEVELHEDAQWLLTITVVNNDASNDMTGVMVQDNLGGDLELLEVNGETVTQPTNKKDTWSDSTGDVDVMWTGKTDKAHLWWNVGTLSVGGSATFTLLVSTDINPGQGKKAVPKNEYTETGTHYLNSGATATGLFDDIPFIIKTAPIEVECVAPNG